MFLTVKAAFEIVITNVLTDDYDGRLRAQPRKPYLTHDLIAASPKSTFY